MKETAGCLAVASCFPRIPNFFFLVTSSRALAQVCHHVITLPSIGYTSESLLENSLSFTAEAGLVLVCFLDLIKNLQVALRGADLGPVLQGLCFLGVKQVPARIGWPVVCIVGGMRKHPFLFGLFLFSLDSGLQGDIQPKGLSSVWFATKALESRRLN